MGSVKSFFLRHLFPSSVEMVVLDVLYHLIIYLWTKRYKCCIKSANYVKLASGIGFFFKPVSFFSPFFASEAQRDLEAPSPPPHTVDP